MKVKSGNLANTAFSRMLTLMDEDLSNIVPDPGAIEEARFCLDILDQISQRKKRFVVDIIWPLNNKG